MTDGYSHADYYKIQHFIRESPWSAADAMASAVKDVNTLFEGRKGKVSTKLLPNKKSINANKHIAGLNQKDWEKVNLRNGTKGALEVETYTKRMYLWDGVENTCVSKMLIVSIKKDS